MLCRRLRGCHPGRMSRRGWDRCTWAAARDENKSRQRRCSSWQCLTPTFGAPGFGLVASLMSLPYVPDIVSATSRCGYQCEEKVLRPWAATALA